MKKLEARHFHGYTFYEDGTVIGLLGRKLKLKNDSQIVNRSSRRVNVKLCINGEERVFTMARLMYCLFNGLDIDSLDKSLWVTFKDGDKLNLHIDNLELVHCSEINGEKLSQKEKFKMFDMRQEGVSVKELASMFGVSESFVQADWKGMLRQ